MICRFALTLASLAPLIDPLSAAPAAPRLSASERALASYVDVRNAEGLALLERVVNINSGTHNLSGARGRRHLSRGAGLDRLQDAMGFPDEFKRGGHLVADHPGPGPRMLLIGHLDTVFEPHSPFQKLEHIDANTARGPGVIDMKGGDVIIVQALKALHARVDERHRGRDGR